MGTGCSSGEASALKHYDTLDKGPVFVGRESKRRSTYSAGLSKRVSFFLVLRCIAQREVVSLGYVKQSVADSIKARLISGMIQAP